MAPIKTFIAPAIGLVILHKYLIHRYLYPRFAGLPFFWVNRCAFARNFCLESLIGNLFRTHDVKCVDDRRVFKRRGAATDVDVPSRGFGVRTCSVREVYNRLREESSQCVSFFQLPAAEMRAVIDVQDVPSNRRGVDQVHDCIPDVLDRLCA